MMLKNALAGALVLGVSTLFATAASAPVAQQDSKQGSQVPYDRAWQHDDGTITWRGKDYESWDALRAELPAEEWRCGAPLPILPGAQWGHNHIEGEGGIAEALSLAEHFAEGGPICVVLGDNIIEKDIKSAADAYRTQTDGAKILLKKVSDPQRFGVPEIEGDRIVRIEEKPRNPKSDYAVIGIYFYDNTVFDVIKTLKPSERGELEITDVNNHYIEKGNMTWSELDGWWTDAGTFESLRLAGNLVAERRV